MTRTDNTETQAHRMLHELDVLTSEAALAREVDVPVNRRAGQFRMSPERPMSQGQFLDCVARFVRHMRGHAVHDGWVPDEYARDDAMLVLEQGYEGARANGYLAAFLDATTSDETKLADILMKVAVLFREQKRQRYLHWVVARYLRAVGWAERCAMAQLLLNEIRSYLPEEMRSATGEQYAGDVFDLLMIHRTIRPELNSRGTSASA
ncbi:MAG: hypothetical protein JXQ75_11360 [Phycisphaerae bacterium]|nr:hypothetical protein [Phycisphaerae bacterium]